MGLGFQPAFFLFCLAGFLFELAGQMVFVPIQQGVLQFVLL